MKDPKDLAPGDWFATDFGFDLMVFYVQHNTGTCIVASRANWLATSTHVFSVRELQRRASEGGFSFIGPGKPRWWWRWLPWRAQVVPFSGPNGGPHIH